MNLLKTTAIASSLVAASFVMGTGMAKAQLATEDFTFTFNGVLACTLDAHNPGVLGYDVGVFNQLVTTTPATSQLNCNGPAAYEVGAAGVTAAGAPVVAINASTVEVSFGGTVVAEGAEIGGGGAFDLAVSVDLSLTADADIPAGIPYTFTVPINITAVP